MNTSSLPALDQRRVGEYGHYVQPLRQLAEDLEAFLGIELQQYLPEIAAIRRDEQGVHPEEAALLYLLVRGLRPALMLETGTFKGYSTSEIARALQLNGSGHVITVDLAEQTGTAVPPELLPYITFHRGQPSQRFAQALERSGERLDLFFHDSLHTFMNTLGELVWFADRYAPGSVIVCHDAKMDYMDDFGVGKAVRRFAKELGLPYRVLDTTCGLAVLKWPEQPSAAALRKLREEHALMAARAAEGQLKKALRRLARL
jgi:predicted O-methyltransferase YrrM